MFKRSFVILIALLICLGAFEAPVALAAKLGVPADVSIKRASTKNTLSWAKVSGAAGYKVYAASSPSGKYKLLTSTKKTSYTHKKAPAAQFYKVRAYKGKTTSAYSSPVGTVAGVTDMKATAQASALNITWKAAKHATGYTLRYAKSESGPWMLAKENIQGKSYAHPIASTDPVYFKITSLYNGVESGVSEVFSAFAPLKDVKVICEETYNGGPTDKLNITWSLAGGATQYEVLRATLPSTTFEMLGTTTKTYYKDTRHPTLAYAYKVRPVYGNTPGAESKTVTLWSDMPANVLPEPSTKSATGIVLLVNKKAQVVTAYTRDASGKYTIPLRNMICSTGSVYERTPTGDFSIISKMSQWYRYPSGVYIRYPSVYTKGLYFHSVLYSSGKKVTSNSISKLGTRQSLGCIRLKVSDAKWVYDYCKGSTVSIVDGKSNAALKTALKPRNVKIN